MDKNLHLETLCIQAGYTPGNGEPRQIPIIQSTTFKYATSEDMGKLFDLLVPSEVSLASSRHVSTRPPLCACVLIFSCKDTSPMRWRPTL